MRFREDNIGDSQSDQKEREKLAACESGNERRIRLPEIFDDDPKDGVANEKQSSEDAVWLAHSRADKPENREQQNSFAERLVELRRMARCENPAQGRDDIRMCVHTLDDCFRRGDRWINLATRGDRAFCFRGIRSSSNSFGNCIAQGTEAARP